MPEAATAEKLPEQDSDQPEKAVEVPGITQSRLGLEVEKSNRWRVDLPEGITREDVMDPNYWQHVAVMFKPGDEIVCMPDNMAWKLVLHVVGAGRLYAHVAEESYFELAPLEQTIRLPSIYEVKFKGTHHKWAVIRGGNPLKDGFETEALARRYAANHESAVQR